MILRKYEMVSLVASLVVGVFHSVSSQIVWHIEPNEGELLIWDGKEQSKFPLVSFILLINVLIKFVKIMKCIMDVVCWLHFQVETKI